jgi:hypothetical protein
LTVITIIVFLFSLSGAKSLPKYLSLAMFSIGLSLNVVNDSSTAGIMEGITSNIPLLTLITLVPLLSIPLKIGGYFESIHYYLWKLATNAKKMFGSITIFLFWMGPILNLGSIRILHEMVKDIQLPAKFLSEAYLRGFSSCVVWSPYFASVALVLYYLDVPIIEYIPLGLSFAFIQFAVGNVMFWAALKMNRFGRTEPTAAAMEKHIESDHEAPYHSRKTLRLIVILFFLMGTIFLMESITKWPMMFLVSLMAVTFPLIWSVFNHTWEKLGEHFTEFKQKSVPSLNNEIVLFISAGLFGKALAGTAVEDMITVFLGQVSSISFYLFVVVIMGLINVFAFFGIHQIVVVTVLVTSMNPAALGTSPSVLALMLLSAWSISAVLSPINPLNLLVSGSVNKTPLIVGFRWNGLFLLMMFFLSSTFIYLIH